MENFMIVGFNHYEHQDTGIAVKQVRPGLKYPAPDLYDVTVPGLGNKRFDCFGSAAQYAYQQVALAYDSKAESSRNSALQVAV